MKNSTTEGIPGQAGMTMDCLGKQKRFFAVESKKKRGI
jgi:hypothetical protein